MSNTNDELKEFDKALSSYVALYKKAPGSDGEKLKALEESFAKIHPLAKLSLAAVFGQLAKDADALRKRIQKNKNNVERFIRNVAQLKETINNTAQVLALIDTALVLAAGIANKC